MGGGGQVAVIHLFCRIFCAALQYFPFACRDKEELWTNPYYVTIFILTTLNQVKHMNPGVQTSSQCLRFPHLKRPLDPRKRSRTLPYPVSMSILSLRQTVMLAIASRRRFRSNNTIAGVKWIPRQKCNGLSLTRHKSANGGRTGAGAELWGLPMAARKKKNSIIYFFNILCI